MKMKIYIALAGLLLASFAANAQPSKMPLPHVVAKQLTVTGPSDLQGAVKVDGTSMTASAAELNALDGVEAGTVTASKAVVVGAQKNIDTITVDASMKLTPTDTVPSLAEGVLYADDSENALKFYNGSQWLAFSPSTDDNTLDEAYDQGGAGAGRTVTADGGAVTITNTDADAAFVLELTPTPGSAAALGGAKITVGANSTEDALQIANAGSGSDIQGTSSTWTISKAGAIAAASVTATGAVAGATASVTGAATVGSVAFANGGAINNDTNGNILLSEAGEDLSLVFTSNLVSLLSGTGVVQLAFGAVDALTGLESIAFDAAAASVTTATDGAGQDLTVGITGVSDSSLIVSSTGTAADALQVTTTAGGIDISNGGAAAGEDLDISSTNASVNITAAENVSDAIVLTASAGGIDVLATGAAGEDIDVSNTGGSINVIATEASADAVVINANANGAGIDVSAQNDIDIAMTNGAAGEDITVSNTGGSVVVSATEDVEDAIGLTATTGGINITADGAAASDLDLVCTNGSATLSGGEDAADAVVVSAGAGGIDVSATGAAGQDIDIVNTGGSVNVTATENAADAVVVTASAGGIDIAATGAAAEDIDITNTGGSVNITATEDDAGAIYIRANGGVSEKIRLHADQGTGAGSITLESDDGGITLDAGADDDILLSSALDVDDAIVGDGGGAISGMIYTVTNDTDGKNVAIAEAQTVQTNAGAGAPAVWNLPEASTAIGAAFTFVVGTAQNLDINPDDADTILIATNAAGDALRCATAGSTVTLLAIDATNWVVIAEKGTWTDVN